MTQDAASHTDGRDGSESIQAYARLAGILGLVTVVAGTFGEVYVPNTMLVTRDPAATAQRILGNESLFRWGFAAYLVEALCDAALTMAFWVLVRPVHRNLAMLMVVLRIISTCGFGASQMLYFGAFQTLRASQSVATLEPAQMEALAYILQRVAAFGGALFTMFYGVANIVFGWLIHRSGYLPGMFGSAIVVMGIPFTVRTFLLVLAPAYASGLLLATAAVPFIPFILWLLVKGVDEDAWRRAVAAG